MIKTQDYIREFITTLFIRKNIILCTTAIFIVAACLIVFFWPPIFVSTGSILVKNSRPLKSLESVDDVGVKMTQVSEEDLFSEMQILTSSSVAERTVKQLQKEKGFFKNEHFSEKAARQLVDKMEENLSIELAPKSSVIKVSFTWQNPEKAEQILQTYLQEYLNYRAELYNPKEAQSFFYKQVHKFNEELKKQEDKLVQLAEKGSLSDPKRQIQSNLLIQENLEKEITSLKNERTEKETYIQHIQNSLSLRNIDFFTSLDDIEIGNFEKKLYALMLQKHDLLKVYGQESPKVQSAEKGIQDIYESLNTEVQHHIDTQETQSSQDINFFTSVDNIEIGDFGKILHGLMLQKYELLKIYTPESPKVQRIEKEIQDIYKSLKAEVQRYVYAQKAQLQGIEKNITVMESKLYNLEERNVELYKSTIKSDRIGREIGLLSESYKTFAKRLEEINIATNTSVDTLFNVGILSKPKFLAAPVFPDKKKVIPLGFLLGLIVGVTIGFLLEFFDHSFKRPEDVYNYTNLPYIYSVPKW